MPETINGYELFPLCGKESEESISFAEYEIDLGEDGYYSSVMYGADTGLRRWNLKFPSVAAFAAATVTMKGVTTNPATYLWDLFCRSKVSGVPFAVQSPRNDQYYLAKFAEKELTYQRMMVKLFSTGIQLKQVRVPGATVFDVSKMNGLWTWLKADAITGYDDGELIDNNWPDSNGNVNEFFDPVVTSTYETNEQNGLPIVRLNGTSSVWKPLGSTFPFNFCEALMVMKVREDTFSNDAGVLTADDTLVLLVGNTGTTKFHDVSATITTLTYRKNGIEYTQANQQAPMNEFGLVHVRSSAPVAMTGIQFGQDRAISGRFAKMDVGELIIFNQLQPLSEVRELAAHLLEKWDI